VKSVKTKFNVQVVKKTPIYIKEYSQVEVIQMKKIKHVYYVKVDAKLVKNDKEC